MVVEEACPRSGSSRNPSHRRPHRFRDHVRDRGQCGEVGEIGVVWAVGGFRNLILAQRIDGVGVADGVVDAAAAAVESYGGYDCGDFYKDMEEEDPLGLKDLRKGSGSSSLSMAATATFRGT
jgi:hypothetical protein